MKVLIVAVSIFAILPSLQGYALPQHPCEGKKSNEMVLGFFGCNVFFICNGKNGGERRVCLKGYHFDLEKKSCQYNGKHFECKNNNYPWGQLCQTAGERYYPMIGNCNGFYQCDNGKLVEKECPKGLHFNPKINVCDYPTNVNCRWGKSENI
ncbi:chitin-binding domain protein cbd-1-like [Episyrphus balteatus]|uniref:chitin-binding domain protein cbd-1-like n=1 Tax=Episyrphus balteatus TaxID=286459 RepID=UPI002485F05E|nr:chitin-binding domain protein cbd-1-like [Episyrphus balteatus]